MQVGVVDTHLVVECAAIYVFELSVNDHAVHVKSRLTISKQSQRMYDILVVILHPSLSILFSDPLPTVPFGLSLWLRRGSLLDLLVVIGKRSIQVYDTFLRCLWCPLRSIRVHCDLDEA